MQPKLDVNSKETCSGTRLSDGGHLLLMVSLLVIGSLFSHRIVIQTDANYRVAEILERGGFV
ncbi:hypothetical protein K0M31_006072 [Melipona bicolor]|uniref:Uncharacterized protein n=1 Tax=Melipona bicolor TaxID=60889 RepID=A0AA40KLN0_9HYME|nr:hypothetical protein K0M31_006072 [Melipona bicolor]